MGAVGCNVSATDFRILRGRAIHIHDEMVYADAAGFFGMNSLWDTTSQALHFGTDGSELRHDEHDTIVHIYQASNEVVITATGHAIGHYARWITRGSVRLESASDNSLLQATAFRDTSQGRLVVVAINNAAAPHPMNVSVKGLPLLGKVQGEQSTAAAYWQPLAPFSVASATNFSLTLPAQSVTSLSAETDRNHNGIPD